MVLSTTQQSVMAQLTTTEESSSAQQSPTRQRNAAQIGEDISTSIQPALDPYTTDQTATITVNDTTQYETVTEMNQNITTPSEGSVSANTVPALHSLSIAPRKEQLDQGTITSTSNLSTQQTSQDGYDDAATPLTTQLGN